MLFKPELVTKILSGQKTVTRRRLTQGRHIPYQVGHTYAVQPGRGKQHVGHIRIRLIEKQCLFEVRGWRQVRAEGFLTIGQFRDYWRRLHHGYNEYELVAVLRFELVGRCPKCLPWEPKT